MLELTAPFLLTLLCSFIGVVTGQPHNDSPPPKCLSDFEAWDITTKYLHLYDSGAVTSQSQVNAVLAPNMLSYDEVGPYNTGPYATKPATSGAKAFFDSVSAGGPSAYTNSTQKPLHVMHSCDEIAYRWQFKGYATGQNSTVPAGTYLEFKGNDIVTVDLKTRLIVDAKSSGDWLNLARELGQIRNVSCAADPLMVSCIV